MTPTEAAKLKAAADRYADALEALPNELARCNVRAAGKARAALEAFEGARRVVQKRLSDDLDGENIPAPDIDLLEDFPGLAALDEVEEHTSEAATEARKTAGEIRRALAKR